jgi:protoporphyrinogen oxidase
VIGSGITAASFSHYLYERFSHVDLHIFERQDRIGGRLHTIQLHGQQLELGGTFIVSENLLMRELAAHYALKLESPLREG